MRPRRTRAILWMGAVTMVVAVGCTFLGGPEATIDVSVTTGVVPLTIQFSGEGSSAPDGITSYRWLLGTGEERFDPSGSATYQHAGRYTLTLTVRSAGGKTATASVEVVVEPAVWTCDENLDRVHKLDMTGAVLATFDLPVSGPRGVTVAESGGSWWLVVACYGDGNQRLVRIDPTDGTVTETYAAPAQDPLFLAYGAEEPERIWHVDGLSRKIYGMNPPTTQVFESFGTNTFRASQQVGNELFLQSPQGLAWTGDDGSAGRLWYLEGETQLLYGIRIDPPMNIFEGIQLEIDREPVAIDPSVFPVAGMDLYDGRLWVVDRDRHELVEVDPSSGVPTGVRIGGFPGANVSGLAIQH